MGTEVLRKILALPAFAFCVFGTVSGMLLTVMPGPRRDVDYFVIGGIGVLIAQFAVFILLTKTSHRTPNLFFKKRRGEVERPMPRVRTSMLGLS